MASKIRKLIPQLLTDARLEQLQRDLTGSCLDCLETQGLHRRGGPSFQPVCDTGVGAMRKISTQLTEPTTGARLQLLVCLLAKIDGSVRLWSELWGAPGDANLSVEKGMARQCGEAGSTTPPSRIRLMRQNLFEGQVGSDWARHPRPLEVVCQQLDLLGLFSANVLEAERQAQLAAVLSL